MQGLEFLSNLKGWVGEKGFSLARISLVADALNRPQDSFRSIHVAGSNGKGSVCATISQILKTAKFKVGMTISPHLFSITERIVVDGQPVSEKSLAEVALIVESACKALSVELSQFEAITLCAFLIFREENVDFGVIEVGLGGRLDATNIISKPDIAAIVSISNDHQDVLGPTLEAIALEKSGIIKKGCKLVLGAFNESVREVILSVAEQNKTDVFLSGQDFKSISLKQSNSLATYQYEDKDWKERLTLESRLLGLHQANNIGIAVKIALLLGVKWEDIREAVFSVSWPCRLEFFRFGTVNLLIDCAHNEAGLDSLLSFIKEIDYKPKIIIFGVLATKNWSEMLRQFKGLYVDWLLIEPYSDQAVSSDLIERFISDHELGRVFKFGRDYEELVKHVAGLPPEIDGLVAGSMYMVGKLRHLLEDKAPVCPANSLSEEQLL